MRNGRARYDGHADWYDEAFRIFREVPTWRAVITRALGRPDEMGEICLDVGCGTGLHAETVIAAGYTPVGVDISADQLRIAKTRFRSVVRGDAAQLPVADSSVNRVLCLFTHTDLDDFAAVVREAARVLQVGGRLAYIGLHPCYVGTFVDRRQELDEEQLALRRGYGDASVQLDRTGRFNMRSRVGGNNLSFGDFLKAFLSVPSLALRSFVELDTNAQPWNEASDGRVVPWNIALSLERVHQARGGD